jgi:RNA polymerase sigma-70 factor (ECF subfamily)
MIAEAETALRQAAAFARPGRFQIEAAVQSAHAARRHSGTTDWPAVADLYALLYEMTGSPVVAVNRDAALSEAGDVEQSLSLIRALTSDERLAGYQPYWAARAAIMERGGLPDEASEAYGRAIGLEQDEAVRVFLIGRRSALASRLTPPS